ncbi:MAG: ATPase [Haloarculaceae archaeon]
MKLLVTGGARVDAGKTTFSTGLVAYTGARGYKPRAGNDYWYDHDDVRAAAEAGRLYGKDARRLAAASPGDVAPEDVNPVHRLWAPSPDGGKGLLGREDREFLVDRVGESYVVNGTVEVPDLVRERLPVESGTVVDSLAEFDEAMETLHATAFDRMAARLADADRAVVESYADIALPLTDLDPDAVAVVEPGRCRIYRGERYVRGREVASGSAHEGRLEERVGDVTELLDPVASVALPALPSDQRTSPEAVADAYTTAYESLLRAADTER